MTPMWDAAAFLKPIAHRGLHSVTDGLVENTAGAFKAAIAKGYGIECDVRPSACATPMIFHDETLARLTEVSGPVHAHGAAALKGFKFRHGSDRIIDLSELLELVDGCQPILVEIKSEWQPPDQAFLQAIAKQAASYRGPLALMSFDPAVMSALRELTPQTPRGIVSGRIDEEPEWRDLLGPERAYRLSHLLESREAAPDFYAYQVGALPTAVTRFVREVLTMPLFTWTVRTPAERATATRWADAPIFEGFEP
jgi:glycerophosphoryl diester phosphodiesterase